MQVSKWPKMLIVSAGLICASYTANAQLTWTPPAPPPVNYLEKAQAYVATKNYDSAIIIYRKLYEESGEAMYTPYFNTLIEAKKYKDAEKLASSYQDKYTDKFVPEVDLGRVYKLQGKDKKAVELFEKAVAKINGDDMLTQRIVKAFTDADLPEYAIKAYEQAIQRLGNPYLYAVQLANLYAKNNQIDKAMDVVMTGSPGQFITVDNVKALFLQWMGTDPKKLQTAQKCLMGRINEEPNNTYYVSLLTWIYTQKNDWDGALIQMEAVDERNNETGKTLMDFAHVAAAAKKYDIAFKAYDDVIAKGAEKPLYGAAKSEKITAQLAQLKTTPNIQPESITALLKEYDAVFVAYPQNYSTPAASDYAMIAAQYADSIDKAIAILKYAITYPGTRVQQVGALSLQLGDYYVIKGKVWDASLIYSQVDKQFKQDMLGEDARFRNAKLHYYRGDFEWAQSMLSVLKRSTTELIANDALFLSVQITENVQDSNFYPLARFAYADLLLFQNKDKQAEALLDSISTAFPKHPLNDDILMQHAKIAMKHTNYDKAITFLTEIVQKFPEDLLADDAVFTMAEIYNYNLNKKDSAKEYYEKLIIDFPGSTFVQVARQKLGEINNPVP